MEHTYERELCYEKIPKVELHVHLEGAIPQEALWELIRKYGGDPDVPDPAALAKRFTYRSFSQFIETWVWKNRFIREYDDFTLIASAVAADLSQQNIQYAELFFSPSDFKHLTPQRITDAIREGFNRVSGIELVLVADLVRDFGTENAENVLHAVREVKNLGIAGIGIGGSEKEFPPELFRSVFEKAREFGFRTSAHAGEAAGPESIRAALEHLHVDRIGHGTRAIEDEKLVKYLVDNSIPVEVCPISNIRTGVVKSYKDHPVRSYYDQGLFLSINTDDPAMFGNTLAQEFRYLENFHGFTRSDIKKLILQAITMSWMPENRKKQMTTQFKNSEEWVR